MYALVTQSWPKESIVIFAVHFQCSHPSPKGRFFHC